MDTILDRALELSRMGLAVHFLAPKGKCPIAKGWQKRPYASPDDLLRTWRPGCNIGVVCGLVGGARHSVVVIDADSPSAVAWVTATFPPTPVRTVTRRGQHWFFGHPGDGRLGSKVRLRGLPADVSVDIRGDGGQVVVAPSVHPSGFIYREGERWTRDALATMPVFDRRWITTSVPSAPSVSVQVSSDDLALRIRRATRYLEALPAAISGKGGHLATWRAALVLVRGFALPREVALDIMLTSYNSRCSPPWSWGELEHKIYCAATDATVPLGYLL